MIKPLIVVQGPVATRSGYGNHTRDLVTSLIKADKYDVKIASLPWGGTPMNALEADNADHIAISKRILREMGKTKSNEEFLKFDFLKKKNGY